MRIALAVLFAAALPFAASIDQASADSALSDEACAAAWKKAGVTNLNPEAAKPFIKNFEQVDVDKNGAIDWEEFKAGCKNGLVNG